MLWAKAETRRRACCLLTGRAVSLTVDAPGYLAEDSRAGSYKTREGVYTFPLLASEALS